MGNASKFFTVLVVGDKPDELMAKYDMSVEVEPYLKYKFSDKEKMKNNAVKVLSSIISDPSKFGITEYQTEKLQERLDLLKKMSPFAYYCMLVEGLPISDEGDAYTKENPDGKWTTYRIGDNFCEPFLLKDGTTSYTAKCGDVDWKSMKERSENLYSRAWDLAHGAEPENDEEVEIAQNMSEMDNYLSTFNSKEAYVVYNSAYWNYAFLDKDGWVDIDECNDSFKWVTSFYDKFIRGKLKEDDMLTLYECSRKKEQK